MIDKPEEKKNPIEKLEEAAETAIDGADRQETEGDSGNIWKATKDFASPLLGIAFKSLVCLICLAIFVLLSSILLFGALVVNEKSLSSIGEMPFYLLSGAGVTACFVFIIAAAYGIVCTFGGTKRAKKTGKLLGAASFIAIVCVFLLCAAAEVSVLYAIDEHHLVGSILLAISFASVSFVPIVATWHIRSEERLKNFIDALSKAFSCLAVITGAIVVIGKLLGQI